MKAEQRRSHERILSIYQGMLDSLNRIGPSSDSHEDLAAFGEVKDYLLDRIEERETILRNAHAKHDFSRGKKNSLHPSENTSDNCFGTGVANG